MSICQEIIVCLRDEDALKKILEDKHEMEKYNRAVICLDLDKLVDKISGSRLEESSLQGDCREKWSQLPKLLLPMVSSQAFLISYSYQYERPKTYLQRSFANV